MRTDRQAVSRTFGSTQPLPLLRGKLTRLSLAVALAMPVIAPVSVSLAEGQPVTLLAMQDNGATPADPKAQLNAALDLYKAGQYEEAQTALQAIKGDTLNDADKATLAKAMQDAEKAAGLRRQARANFERGEGALAAGNNADAAGFYKQVIANEYADEGTKAKAREQLALTQASQKGAETDLKTVYNSAVDDYKAGRLDEAKGKFTQLQEARYSPGWFNKSPRDYISDIERQQAPKSRGEEARSAYLNGREQYRKGDWIGARQNFNKAVELGYKPHFAEESPKNYLAIMDKKENADAQAAARSAMARGDVPSNNGTPTSVASQSDEAALREISTAKRLEAEQKAAQAQHLVQSAQAAERENHATDAVSLYTKALELDPTNQQAIEGRNRTLGVTGLTPTAEPLEARTRREIEARRDSIRFAFNMAIDRAQMEIGRNQYGTARTALTQAEVARNQEPAIFSSEEVQDFDNRIAAVRVELARSEQANRDREAADAARRARDAAADRDRVNREAKEQAVATLIADARRLESQKRYDEALKAVNQILVIDPTNSYATGVSQILFDRASLQRQRELNEKMNREVINTYNQIDERKIPYSDVLTYPADWPDLSARRDQTVREERAITAADEAIAGLLEKALPEIRFSDVAFADVLDFLRDTTQANIFVNWKALEAAGIDRNTPVSTRLRNVKFSKVLRTILESVGGGGGAGAAPGTLGYTVDEGVITISTAEDLARNVETRTYDIRDLIIAIPDFDNAPDFSLQNQANGQNGTSGGRNGGGGGFGGGGGGGGGGLFGDSNSSNQNEEDENTPTRQELVDQITKLIKDTIGAGTWKDEGGQLGSLSELGGQLIVTQTPEIHRQISQLLEKLREQRSIQVMIEARFLTVQRNFLEDVGVDFDFFLNNDGPNGTNPYTGAIPGSGPLQQGINGPITGFGPINVQQNSSSFTQPGSLQTGVNGNLGGDFSTPNIQTSITAFLDDFQASLLIRATQGNQSVTQLTAPRVTLFNGQRAYVLVSRQIAYVSDLTPIVGSGSIGFDPEIDVIQSGVVLDVTATVSADRKYVTLTLRPQLSRIIAIRSFQVSGTSNNNDDDNTGGGGVVVIGGGATASGFIQQPEIEITEVRTSVSVPDGGTLLLGGTTISGEIEREAGVPVVSKIPFLKRAFTNRSFAKDESVLLIMVKPTIIIQREIEQQNFPLLSSRPG